MLNTKIKRHKNEITAFNVGEHVYRVVATSHGILQMKERTLDQYYIASACLALGLKLDLYNNTGTHIMLIDELKDLAAVITVENYSIVLITVIDKADVFAKSNTVIENLRQEKAV